MTEIEYRAKVIEIELNFIGVYHSFVRSTVSSAQTSSRRLTLWVGTPWSLSTVTCAEFGEKLQRQIMNACSTEDQVQVIEQAISQLPFGPSFVAAAPITFILLDTNTSLTASKT